jgi:hypothetical protein
MAVVSDAEPELATTFPTQPWMKNMGTRRGVDRGMHHTQLAERANNMRNSARCFGTCSAATHVSNHTTVCTRKRKQSRKQTMGKQTVWIVLKMLYELNQYKMRKMDGRNGHGSLESLVRISAETNGSRSS